MSVTWGLFSLAIVNWDKPMDEFDPDRGRGVRSLRAAVKAREVGGNDGIGAYYRAIGHRAFDLAAPVDDIDTIRAAAVDAGFDAALADDALADASTWEALKSEHAILCDETRSFGVPTIRLDGGRGPALFGPVISNPAETTEEAVELWRHVRWLIAYDNFAELKRDRLPPDLEAHKRRHGNSG